MPACGSLHCGLPTSAGARAAHATRGHGGFLLAGWRMSCGWKHPMASMDGARCIVCLLCWWWVFDIFYYKTALLTCLAKVVSDACIGTTFWQTNLVPVFGGFGAWSRFNWICSGWMQWAVIHLGRVPNRLLALPKEKLAAPLEFWVNRKSPTVGSLTKNWCFLSAGRCPNLVNLQSACFTSYQPRKWHPVASIYIYIVLRRGVHSVRRLSIEKNKHLALESSWMTRELRPGVWFLTSAKCCFCFELESIFVYGKT